MLLYYLCVGATLFQGTVEDNIFDDNNLFVLAEREDQLWNQLLAKVPDRYARNLISLLLHKDPEKRPLTNRVLSHPFLTGKHPARLNGEKPDWDVFLSYRVNSDLHHAEMIYEALRARGNKVW